MDNTSVGIILILLFHYGQSETTIPLFRSAGMVGYNFQFNLGTPPQVLAAETDTGFGKLVVPSPRLGSCGQGFPSDCYDLTASSTFRYVTCGEMPSVDCANCTSSDQICVPSDDAVLFYSPAYTWMWGSDIIQIGESTARIVFLIFESSEEDEDLYFGGDFGLMWPYLSEDPINSTSVLWNLQQSPTSSLSGSFSFFMNDTAGQITFEDDSKSISDSKTDTITLEAYLNPNGNYNFTLVDVTVGGHSLLRTSENENVFYWAGPDSGTWGVRVPEATYENFHAFLLNKYCAQGNSLVGVCDDQIYAKGKTLFQNYCYKMTEKDIEKFPPVDFILKSLEGDSKPVTLSWLPQNYLSNFDLLPELGYSNCTSPSMYAFAWMAGSWASSGGVVIGAEMLSQYINKFEVNANPVLWSLTPK